MAVKVRDTDPESTVIVKTLMRMTGTSVRDIADVLGMESTSGVSMLLKSDMKYSKFVQIIHSMGYEIQLIKQETTEK